MRQNHYASQTTGISTVRWSFLKFPCGSFSFFFQVDSGVHTNSLLDSLSVTSGQMHMLCRKLSLNTLVPIASSPAGQQNQQQSKYSLLSSVVFTPQNLSMAQDDHLAQLTEGRARFEASYH